MKNKEKIQILEHRLNIHSELLERIISKLEFDDANEPEPKKLDHSVFDGLDSKWEYAAVDANGEAHLYTHHITPDSVEFAYCDAMDFDCQTIGTDYDVIDWKNSLIKRESKPQLKQLDQDIFIDLDSKWIFAAIDKNGSVWVYTHKPFVDSNYWYVEDLEGTEIGQGYDTSNWQTSLIKRETFELTGSELCKAMLARGDTRIMCIVSDTGTRDDVTHVIRVYEDGRFHTKANSWKNAVPINNHGEPLTASDVDL